MPDMKQVAREAAFWPTIQQAADDYGVSYRVIRGAVERGEVTAVRIDKIRVSPDSVDRWFADRYWPAEG